MSATEIDVLSVGDIVTDAFIRLQDDQAKIVKDKDTPWLTMPFGVKIPFDHAEVIEAVGNAANASVSFARLGLKSALMANVGGDQHGRDMFAALHKNHVDTRLMHVNPGKISNYHYVLWYKNERTILIKHEKYPYHWPHLRPHELPKWVYFSSISKDALGFHDDMAEWLEKHPEVKLAFQPGTFQIEAGKKRLERLYKRSELLAVNREEAVTISGGKHDDIGDLLDRLHSLGPKIVVISDGPDGAYASDGQQRLKMPIYPDPSPPYERTGAGDAFTSTFVAAIIKGSDIAGALQWAPINSMSVVQYVGAQKGLLTEAQLSHLLRQSPAWYRPTPLK
ncbi:MAG TPA: carbohydrate kinase family protein [Candidatus Saccharibacteria bacterium]|nr:carbohydrate kinase family protein [Candidatus Saccharibacteria bacterium]